MLRRIPLGKMNNLRDLGGYPAGDGGTTVWERLLRGDVPTGFSEEDIDWLLERDITTVVDLRHDDETEYRPDELKFIPGFTYHHCNLAGGGLLPNSEADVAAGYFRMLDEKNGVAEALRAIAGAPGGVLFHCTAGKDRTGCIAALLLSLAGVSRADILADYQVSETYLASLLHRMRERAPELAAFLGRSKSEYMEGCLNLLTEKYGSVPEYLRSAGLTEAELERLRNKLLN